MHFFENFNSTNQTCPQFAAHDNFVTDLVVPECSLVQQLNYEERCDYVRNTANCQEYAYYFNYVTFLYCFIDATNIYVHMLGVMLLLILCCFMFTILGTTADKFFCPPLTVLSQLMRMSENLAGVTLLAFGNGSPDLFTSLAYISGDTTVFYSELFGAATFITSVLAGTIIVIHPFNLIGAHFVRDTMFFIFASIWVDYAIYDESMSVAKSIVTLLIYLFYLIVVITDQILVNRSAQSVARKWTDQSEQGRAKLRTILNSYKEQGTLELRSRISSASIDFSSMYRASFTSEGEEAGPNLNIFQQFKQSLNPINNYDWEKSGLFMKLLMILKAPIVFLLLLILPIVDYNEEAHGWSKLLNIIHLNTLPTFFILINPYYAATFFGFSIFFYAFAITFTLSVIVFFTSRTDVPPKYHFLFAIITIIGSGAVVSTFAGEVVMILETIGIVSSLSSSFLGSTMLAWGNSIGDLIANMALARQGYQKMAFAACYGGPLFNTLFSLGLVFLIKAVKSTGGDSDARQGSMGPTCTLFLCLILVFSLIALSFTKFVARRSIGIYLFCLYTLFMLYMILGEFEIIHPFGTDHRDQRIRIANFD